MTSEPGGYGPWFCAFLVNTAPHPKKHTHLVSHAMPHLFADALNRNSGEGSQDCWIILLKIGPFNHWLDSVAFLNQWLCKTRGIVHRIERGLKLFSTHRERYGLCLWTQMRTRDDVVNQFRSNPGHCYVPDEAERHAAEVALRADDPCRRYMDRLGQARALLGGGKDVTLSQIRTVLLY